jgi:formylglycine-generating enzyme required for sulfatase activity
MAESFDPYHRWLGIPPKDRPPNHYRLLGLEVFESDVEVIRDAAEQRMAHVRTYQLGRHSELSQTILNELAGAKACLLDPERKASYDETLRSTAPPAPEAVRGSGAGVWKAIAAGAAGLLLLAAIIVAVALSTASPPSAPTPPVAVVEPAPASTPTDDRGAKPADTKPEASRAEPDKTHGGSGQETTLIQGSSPKTPPPAVAPVNTPPLAVAPFDAAEAKRHQEAWAKHLGVPVEVANSLGIKLVLIPPGEFTMGTPESERGPRDQKPQHRVRVTRPFRLAVHEVTVGQFRTFADAAGYQTEAEVEIARAPKPPASKKKPARSPRGTWRSVRFEQTDTHPVVIVTWNDATQFCTWLSMKEAKEYRLPAEAEWEYAARGGTQTRFPGSDDAGDLSQIGNLADASLKAMSPRQKRAAATSDGYAFTAPVGSFRPNNFGLHDVVGNVAELCADWFDPSYYAQSPENDPAGPAFGERRVARGGAWFHLPLSVADRWPMPLTARNDCMGFRVACDVEPAPKRP